jgi:AraC-like DNA-binding protein
LICKCIPPSPDLKDHIREYLIIHLVFENKNVAPPAKAYPVNPEEGIRFIVRGSLVSENPESGTMTRRPTISIFGQPRSRENLHISHEYLMIHVRFQPGGLFRLLGIPMNELIHQNIEAELIMGSEIGKVQARLTESKSYKEMLTTLNGYFRIKFFTLKGSNEPIDKIGLSILKKPQEFNLEKTAGNACLSYRQFEKRFTQQIGITPKYYARVCRFYQAYEVKEFQPKLDWLSIAVRTGYNDYQHLVKDFKQFAGTTPNSLIRESLNNPERRFNITSKFVL